MAATKASLIIPVENQVRELDAKILLSCVAAQRGFSCIIGSRLELDFYVASFPRSLYLSKRMTTTSSAAVRMFSGGSNSLVWSERRDASHFQFYNEKRWHNNFDRKTPAMVWFTSAHKSRNRLRHEL
jgi:hypothetical protein